MRKLVRIGFHISVREFIKFRAEHHPDERILLVYGSGSLERPLGEFVAAFVAAKDSYSEHLEGITFREMRKEPGIQAADMLIWEFNSKFRQALKGNGTFQILRGSTLDRLCRGGVDIRMYGRDMAERLNVDLIE